ncbi:hypothetical protein VTL71DRAFT_6971 [Oculimacula yallundae]|uniref:Uncharacterized protein n=1 Tax=Oculimacula yallundae TaxID=86028 RepID=A0ABR4BWZ5_9HELO
MVSSPPKSSESTSTIPIPPPTATPGEVRTYFSTLLSTHHDLSQATATEAASKWTLGRGEEMSSFDIETYRQIIGWETGTILFGHVNRHNSSKPSSKAPVSQTSRKKPKQDIFGMDPGLALVYGTYVSMILLAVLAYREPDNDRAAAMLIIGVLLAMGFGTSYAIYYFG